MAISYDGCGRASTEWGVTIPDPFSPFDLNGAPVALDDVLVKYTWTGDTNEDGRVDGADYLFLDAGYLTGGVRPQDGDVDFSGVVDGDDFFLVDRAFLSQTSVLAASAPAGRVAKDVFAAAIRPIAGPDPAGNDLLVPAAPAVAPALCQSAIVPRHALVEDILGVEPDVLA